MKAEIEHVLDEDNILYIRSVNKYVHIDVLHSVLVDAYTFSW